MTPEDEERDTEEPDLAPGSRSSSGNDSEPFDEEDESPVPLEDLFLIARALDVLESTGFHWSRADAFASWFERCLDRTWEHFDTLSLRPHEVLNRLAACEAHAAQKNYDAALRLFEEALVLIQAIGRVEEQPLPLIDPLTARVTRVLRTMLRDDLPTELGKSVSQLTQTNVRLLEEARRLISQSQSPLRRSKPPTPASDPFAARAQRANIDAILSESPILEEKIERAVSKAVDEALGSDDFEASLRSKITRRSIETMRSRGAVQWISSIASKESRREIEESLDRNADELFARSKEYTSKKLKKLLPQLDDEFQEVSESMGELNTSLLGVAQNVGEVSQNVDDVSQAVDEVTQSLEELTTQLDKQGGLFTKQGQSLASNIEALRDRLAEIEEKQRSLEEASEPFDDERVLRIVKRFVITREAVQLEERKKLENRMRQFESDFDWAELITDVLQSDEFEERILLHLANFKKKEIDAKKKRRQHTKDQVRKVVEEHLAKKEEETEDYIEAEIASPLPTRAKPRPAPPPQRSARTQRQSPPPALPPAPSRGPSKRLPKAESRNSRRKSTRISGRRRRR